jgi:hypothetical protein
MATPILFREPGEDAWHEGRTRNVSRTGVLFETAPPSLPPGAQVEVILELTSYSPSALARVRCSGKVVRTCSPGPTRSTVAMAATIDDYEFLRIGN